MNTNPKAGTQLDKLLRPLQTDNWAEINRSPPARGFSTVSPTTTKDGTMVDSTTNHPSKGPKL